MFCFFLLQQRALESMRALRIYRHRITAHRLRQGGWRKLIPMISLILTIVVLCQGVYGTKRGKCDAYHTKPDKIPMYALCNDSGVCKLHTIIVCTLIFHHRSSVWWDRIMMDTFQNHDWVENFRMCKKRFINPRRACAQRGLL